MQFGGNLAQDDQDQMQRIAGNCELRSVVMCSHGVRDGKAVPKMTKGSLTAPSDVRMGSVSKNLDQLDKLGLSGSREAPDGFSAFPA